MKPFSVICTEEGRRRSVSRGERRKRGFPAFLIAVIIALFQISSLRDGLASGMKGSPPHPGTTEYRTVRFATAEGTQTSADTFPDGKQLVFDLLGDLYLISADGGTARPLTHGSPYDFWPAVSPDGRWVAFVSDRNGNQDIWLAEAKSGKCRPAYISPEEKQSPAWLDSDRLLFVEKRLGKGWIGITRISSGKTEWICCEGNQAISVTKGPGNTILTCEIVNWHPKILQRDLKDIGGTSRGKEIVVNEYDQISPAVSPDGVWLVYGAFHRGKARLILRPFAGGEEIVVSPFETEYYLSVPEIGGPRVHFTPDGRDLVFSYRGQLHRYGLTTGRERLVPMRIDVDRRVPVYPRLSKRVEANRISPYAKGIAAVALSSDLSRSYVLALGRLWRLDVSDGRPIPLDPELPDAETVLFSPDARHLAFTANIKAGEKWEGLWVIGLEPDANPPGRVLEKAPESLAWSQDGRFLLVVERDTEKKQEKKAFKIVSISTANWKAVETIALAQEVVSSPQRLSNGKVFAAIADEREISQLAEITPGGDALIRTAFPQTVASLSVSPDGSRVSFSTEAGIFWLPFPCGDDSRSLWHRIAEPPAYFMSWTEDGLSIVYYGDGTENIVSLDGKNLKSFPLNIPMSAPPADPPLYLKGGIVVPLGDASLPGASDIVIEDHRISQMKSASPGQPGPDSALDLSGKYLIPGLLDTHVHCLDLDPRAFLAYGVTTIRDAGGSVLRLQQLRELIESERIVGPRLFFCGPAFDGPAAFDSYASSIDGMDIHDEGEAVGRVRRLCQGGADYIKIYERLARGPKQAAFRAAAAEGLNVIGHAERMPAFTTHFLDGIGTMEHGLDSRFYDDFRQLIIRIGTFYDATMMAIAGDLWYLDCHPEILQDHHFLSLAPANVLRGTRRRISRENFTREAYESHIRDKAEPLYGLAFSRQVVAGTDAQVVFPGIGLHWEMEAMVVGGLSPQQALQAATTDAAYSMGIDKDLGSLGVGKLADIVVLNRNPLTDISATKDIALIIKNGRCYSPVDGTALSLEEAKKQLENKTKTQPGTAAAPNGEK